jgi:anti-anti-sigma regulatory factor
LLPEEDFDAIPAAASDGVTIDLTKVESLDDAVATVIDRFLTQIQVQRQDFNGRVLTIRGSDVAMLSMLLDMKSLDLVGQIRQDR